MLKDRARYLQRHQFVDPKPLLVQLGKLQRHLAASGAPAHIKNLRTNELKAAREGRVAALFCYGHSLLTGVKHYVAFDEAQDYDAIACWVEGDNQHLAPIQIKEVVPLERNPVATLQTEVDKLSKYSDSNDLTVVMHLNRPMRFAPADLRIPPNLKIAALWVLAAVVPDQSRWAIFGNFLEQCQIGMFDYPSS